MTVLSQVLAPADAAVWARIQAAMDAILNSVDAERPPHRCTDACQPYGGPIRLGRPGETITPGRPA